MLRMDVSCSDCQGAGPVTIGGSCVQHGYDEDSHKSKLREN